MVRKVCWGSAREVRDRVCGEKVMSIRSRSNSHYSDIAATRRLVLCHLNRVEGANIRGSFQQASSTILDHGRPHLFNE